MSAHARRAIAERQRQIKSILSGNNHTLIQMNSAEFVDYIISVKMKQGKSRSEVVDWLDDLLEEYNSVSSQWKRIKDPLKTGGGLYPLFDDIKALAIIAAAMQRQGNVFGKFKIKVYNGSPAIIMTSYPGIRAHLTGTRYLASNPKVFTIGVGKLEAAKAMKGGFVLTLAISVTFHAVDFALSDQKTWHDLVAGIAIAPLIIVVSVGFLFAWIFSDTTAYVDYVVKSLRIAEKNIIDKKIIINNQIQQLEESYKESPVDFMKKIFSIPTFNEAPRK
ncbi:hypothetical protein [Pseudoalteromonas sp.]|uniref:hypothetical protein n=1 Tax=Pseudoalteromonas sp. TaxID=53249 RepID=UPI0023574144|nr:hypothetical protein [Pseudoalteromonas sp.]